MSPKLKRNQGDANRVLSLKDFTISSIKEHSYGNCLEKTTIKIGKNALHRKTCRAHSRACSASWPDSLRSHLGRQRVSIDKSNCFTRLRCRSIPNVTPPRAVEFRLPVP